MTAPTEEDALLPCPFCRGRATLCAVGLSTLRFQVVCDDCICGTGYCGSADKVKEAWNRRAPASVQALHTLTNHVQKDAENEHIAPVREGGNAQAEWNRRMSVREGVDAGAIKRLLIEELQTAHTENDYSYHNGADDLYSRLRPHLTPSDEQGLLAAVLAKLENYVTTLEKMHAANVEKDASEQWMIAAQLIAECADDLKAIHNHEKDKV